MQQNRQTGIIGESIAAIFLEQNGYTILEKNWRLKHLEVDIIANKADKLHVIEVKTRTNTKFGFPEQSVTPLKMKHLKDAAAEYLHLFPHWKKVQFDVVSIFIQKQEASKIDLFEDVYF